MYIAEQVTEEGTNGYKISQTYEAKDVNSNSVTMLRVIHEFITLEALNTLKADIEAKIQAIQS